MNLLACDFLCVMRGLDPRIPFGMARRFHPKRDGRDKPGHDEQKSVLLQ
jgi:hypothetical protein